MACQGLDDFADQDPSLRDICQFVKYPEHKTSASLTKAMFGGEHRFCYFNFTFVSLQPYKQKWCSALNCFIKFYTSSEVPFQLPDYFYKNKIQPMLLCVEAEIEEDADDYFKTEHNHEITVLTEEEPSWITNYMCCTMRCLK